MACSGPSLNKVDVFYLFTYYGNFKTRKIKQLTDLQELEFLTQE